MTEFKFKTNKFYKYAELYGENMTSESEIKNTDMTKEFWDEIEQEIMNDELVDININAKVRMSKSTVGLYIAKEGQKLLKKHKKREDDKFDMTNIARDEQEYSKRMRDPNTRNTFIVTDEINELESTGQNVTVERALSNVWSNIQAGRYVHRVCCSPKDVADPNADVFLEVISVDRDRKISHCHLYYRMFKGGAEYMQLLGYVNFDVSDLIRIWDTKVKKLFLKNKKTKTEIAKIDYYAKKDFYTNYMIKKYQKMELITKEGIMRPRMLDYAEIILNVEKKLRSLAIMDVLNKNTIKNYVKMHCRKYKIPTSIVGEELMTQEIDGILSLWKNYNRISQKLNRLTELHYKGKISTTEYELKHKKLEDINYDMMETINAQLAELERYKEINDKYNDIHGRNNKED